MGKSQQKLLSYRLYFPTYAYLLAYLLTHHLPEAISRLHLHHCLSNFMFLHILLSSHHLRHFRPRNFVYLNDPELLLNAPDVLHSSSFRYSHAGILEAHPLNRLNIQMSTRKSSRKSGLRDRANSSVKSIFIKI